METRVQVAYHFKIDPAKLVPGQIRLPEQIIRTVSVGDDLTTEKVSLESLSSWDRDALRDALEKQTCEATRTARPAGSAPAPTLGTDHKIEDDEISAF
jgi:hypothetical protein